MKISTDLLAKALQATGKQASGQALQAHDVVVPAVIHPMVKMVGPQPRLATFLSATKNRDTFSKQTLVSQAASQAQLVTDVATFGMGLWDITITLDSVADFTSGSPYTILAANQWTDPATNTVSDLVHWTVLNVPQHSWVNYQRLFTEDGWLLQMVNGATGVGQTNRVSMTVTASRLL